MIQEIHMQIPIDIQRYKAKQNQARYYWTMTRCSYIKLAEYIGISLPQARRWELKFIKERKVKK